jgi:3-deoxy-manno-octulosonate cytidylyltransferase (CMP-KDO synthetase)
MNILALIPARFASTRFPGKPLVKLANKPMIQWVYEVAKDVFNDVFVATDHDGIAKVVTDFGGQFVMTSPEHRSGTDRCAEALEVLERKLGKKIDIVVNIQGDEPFVKPAQLELLLKPFENTQAQISTLVKRFGVDEDIFNPNIPKVVLGDNGKALYFSRSPIPFCRGFENQYWVKEHIFYKHIGLYAYRSQVLREISKLSQTPLELAESLEQLRWLENGYSIFTEETNSETIAIDTPDDLKLAEEYLKSMPKG